MASGRQAGRQARGGPPGLNYSILGNDETMSVDHLRVTHKWCLEKILYGRVRDDGFIIPSIATTA